MDSLWNIIKLYTPFIMSILIIWFVFLIKKSDKSPKEIVLNLFGFVHFPVSITNNYIIKVFLMIFAFLCLSYYLFMDFSSFFPQRLEMQVYYSPQKLKENLSIYSEDELTARHIIYNNFEKYQDEYYRNLDERLKQIVVDTTLLGFFTRNKIDIHSEGETTFIVEKIKGIHNYYIKESNGQLNHILAEARSDKFEFRSLFEKDKSDYDFINPSLWDITLRHEIIIMPSFKESIVEIYSSSNTKFDHRLYGLTKIYTFPYPKFSNTIYLYEKPNVGLIPIGYAVYKEE